MAIDRFDGKYAFLSNFFDSEIVDDDNIHYPTVEHYFQAMKTTDKAERFDIAVQPTPGKAKRKGRHVVLRSDWEKIKDSVMLEGLRQKFSKEPFRTLLLDTGDSLLEEGNTWHDNYWGICYCVNCQDVMGKNHLGKLLMQVRDEIKKGEL